MSATLAKKPAATADPLSLDKSIENAETAWSPAEPVNEPQPRSRKRALVIVLLVIGGTAAGGYAYVRHTAAAARQGAGRDATAKANLGFAGNSGRATAGTSGSSLARIETVPVEVVQRSDILRVTGSLIADERSSVASNTSGIAAEVRVDRGSLVRKNDVLVQIDATDAKNKLAEGQAMLEELKARLGLDGDMAQFHPEDQPEIRLAKTSAALAAVNFRRAQELLPKKAISRTDFDQMEADKELADQRYRQALLQIRQAYQACKTAMARLAILEKAVADTTIRAPFDGWVAEKLVAVGEQICAGMYATKVVTLVRIDPLRLSLTVPQQDVAAIQLGETVRFHVDSFPDRSFTATVKYIAPIVAHDTRSMVVEAVVPNPDYALRPGMFATAEVLLPKKGTTVYAPVGAVQKLGEVARVFVVRDGVAREQVVAVGEADGGKMEIRSGLSGKERLVARPELVHDGDAVRDTARGMN